MAYTLGPQEEKPKRPIPPPLEVERDSNAVGAMLAIGAGIVLLALLLLGCSARIGPGEAGWLMWDVCGYEGGVAAEITVMEVGARLGCTNPPEPSTDEVPEPEE